MRLLILLLIMAASLSHAKTKLKERVALPAKEHLQIQVSAATDPCPIVNKAEPRAIGSPKTKIIFQYDVDVANEDAFQNCEKKFIQLNLCKEAKGAKKVEIQLRSVNEGWQGTIDRKSVV